MMPKSQSLALRQQEAARVVGEVGEEVVEEEAVVDLAVALAGVLVAVEGDSLLDTPMDDAAGQRTIITKIYNETTMYSTQFMKFQVLQVISKQMEVNPVQVQRNSKQNDGNPGD